MPPKKIVKREKHSSLNDNCSENSEEDQKPRKSAKNKNRRPPIVEPPSECSDYEINDNDIYDDDNRTYMKIANEIVTKNAKLPSLFDPNIIPGFAALINNTPKVSAASRVLEASFKVYGKRVDVVHTEARKLDQDVLTRTVEDEKQKKKSVETNEDDPLNESLNDWGGGDGFFSEEDEATLTQKKQKQRKSKAMNVDMTMANFDFEENISMASALPSNSDTSFQFDDDNILRKLRTIAKDRTVLMGKQKRSAKEVEKRLKSANTAAMEYFRKELLKRGGYKGGKEEASDEKDAASDYSYFHNSYYQYAMNKKREKRHVCIDDVAATSEDYSRVYMHNEWNDEEDDAQSTGENAEKEKVDDGPDDGDFIHFSDIYPAEQEGEEDSEDGDDILDGVLEQFQGTLELATANIHKLEDGWVEILGLERKDLQPSKKTDVSFEQTANDDFDPDKRLVDRIVIEGEDEAMKNEEDRVEKLVKELFSGRIKLPGGPGNVNESTLRRRINSPTAVKMYDDEDVFFPFDQSKHVTTESKNSQIAVSRIHFVKHRIVKYAKAYGLPEKLFEALQSFALPTTPIHEDILKIVETLPDYIFVKGLLNPTVAKYDYNQSCQMLSSFITPFRIARYVEQLLNSVIHQVQTSNLKQELFDTCASRAESTRQHSSFHSMNTSLKRFRFDETLFGGETYRYFAAFEHEKTQRYPNQMSNNNDDNQIYKIVSKTLSSGNGFAAFQKERINNYFTGQAIFTLLAYVKFYNDNRGKDLSKFLIIQELSEDIMNDPGEAPSVENNSVERVELLENLVIPAHADGAPVEIDHDFDNDFDFHDAPTSPLQNGQNGSFHNAPNSSQRPGHEVISQDLFASDNENGGGNDDDDDFGGNFFDDIQQESTGTLDDSLAKIVTLEVPVTPAVTTRPKRNSKKIQFVEDESHWKKPANSSTRRAKQRKALVREELLDQHDDNLLFAPRETFANITTSRRRRPLSVSEAMEPTPRIQRCQDSSTPVNIYDKFTFRLELGQTIPGFSDPDKTYVGVGFSEHMRHAFQTTAVPYRGKLSFLPPTSHSRQENDLLFWLRTHRVCSDLSEAKKQESETRKSLEAAANVNDEEINYDGVSGDEYQDAIDHDFDAFDAPSSPPPHIQPRALCGSFMGEYQHYHADDDDDDDEEIDDFDFESKRDKMVTLHYSEGKFALKRAIKYILTNSQYDRTTLPDEISGIKAPPPPQITNEIINTQMLSTSTPAALKKGGTFEFQYDDDTIDGDEIIGGDALQNDIENDEEESDYENDSDETRMRNFKVDGFHTLKSVLFYLPEVCHPDTVRVLSVAHVFCTLCHMANENSLCLIQEDLTLEGIETSSDCRILNLKDAEMLEAEEELDDAMDVSDNESLV